ncbi:MAG: hypothetical protein CMI95_06850 [Pelagibacteraceae bacterium]|nr:hypothetical protein [Pelagibacteraceae bacterium]PPR51496.1 MAG: hypothetical protein CFH20_00562 [Alphaproteobacteria bacterium MarineAlpha5_Bin10]|tara:strand:- start:3565 stop:4281 length:717 start_codon:yes stop_codon:yes gene_type:complete
MSGQLIDIFPLSIFKDKIVIDEKEKNLMINKIYDIEKISRENLNNNNNIWNDKSVWLGDINGSEFLLKNQEFKNLSKKIGEKILLYVEALNIDTKQLKFYFQKSWATVTRKEQNIQVHSHDQSNISISYYLKKPNDSGNIRFACRPHNEIAKDIFSEEKVKLGLIKKVDLRNTTTVDIPVEENDICIFPSKTKHSTAPSNTDESRISISADISLMLVDSYGHEKLMPHFNNWQEINNS